MNVQTLPIESITPYDKNPRNNDDAVEYVANSIKEFGFQQPIVVDKDGVVIVGHTRLKAAKSLGMTEVPVVVADNLTDEQVKAYRLADNKTNELAGWDFDLLDSELADIFDIDMEDFGFSDSNIEWDTIEDLDEDNYEEPDIKKLQCPKCNHIDSALRFKKVNEK